MAATTYGLVVEHARQRLDAPAILAPQGPPLSYRSLGESITRVVRALRGRGVARGDRVATVLPNGPDAAVTFLGVSAACACAPLNPAYPAGEFEFFLGDLKPRLVIVDSDIGGTAAAVCARLGIPALGCGQLSAESSGAVEEADFLQGDEVALLLHTSGTTSRPKLVPLTAENLRRSACNVATSLRLTSDDRCLNVMPLFHIHGLVAAVLASLHAGASVICTPGFVATRFFDWLADLQPTWYTAVPTMHQAILSHVCRNAETVSRTRLRFIRSSSAPLPVRVHADLEEAFRAPVIEAYGMTEAAHQMASNPLPPETRKPGSVGRAAGPEIAVLNPLGRILAPNEPGEVCIRGRNIMPGYLDNPEANEEAFRHGWFHTGDLGWMDADGYLYLTGRSKEIINRGGEKISPREIDEALIGHPEVAQCLTFALPDSKLGEEVGAAIVRQPSATVSEAAIQEFAAQRLVDFKVPKRIWFLPEIPKGPTGKLQRIGFAERLGIAEDAWKTTDPPPLNTPSETVSVVARLMAEVLRTEAVDSVADFFDLGGDSILGAQLLARLGREFSSHLTMVDLFRAPTAAGLAARLAGASAGVSGPPPLRRDDSAPPQLSFGQVRLWFLDEFENGSQANLRAALYEVCSALDPQRLEEAFREIIRRHEPLRTAIVPVDGSPHPLLLSAADFQLEVHDWSAADPSVRESLAREFCRERALVPFMLRSQLPIRAALHRLDDHRWWLLVMMHHAASDGWSSNVLCSELAAILSSEGTGHALPPLPIRYSDYARWQVARHSGGDLARLVDFWRLQLDGLSGPLDLPLDFSRPKRQTFRGAIAARLLPQSLARSLRALSRQYDVTLFMTLLAAFQILMLRYSRSADICVGVPAAGREKVEFEPLIGLFMNILPLRVRLQDDPGFAGLLARVRQTCLDAFSHQELPFEKMVEILQPERDLRRTPFFQVVFQLRNVPQAPLNLPGFMELDFDSGISPFDLSLDVAETAEGLACRLQYCTDLFRPPTADRLLHHYQSLLEAVTADCSTPASRLPLSSAEERQRLIAWGRGRTVPVPVGSVIELFEQQVADRPDQPAVLFRDGQLTFAELNGKANRLSRFFAESGIGRGAVVAVCMDRSFDLVATLLAVLKTGAAYLPLAADYPAARIESLIADSGAVAVVADSECAVRLSAVPVPVLLTHDCRRASERFPDSNPPLAASPDDLVYVLYTSGSTGKPKGVEVENRSLVSFVCSYDWLLSGPEHTVLQLLSLTFDVSAMELFVPLLTGGRLALYDGRRPEPARLGEWIRRVGITFAWLSAPVFNFLIDEAPEALGALRRIIVGGEALSVRHVRRALEVLPETEIVNGYGPTEATILCTGYPVPRDLPPAPNIPIGYPASNCVLYVLDPLLQLCPEGIPGELYVGGACVARGYRNLPEPTAERFIANPFSDPTAPRLYRTGDLVRWRHDGALEFHGRVDFQVKIRGYRVEPGEIEETVRRHPSVRHAGVIVSGDQSLEASLHLLFEPQPGTSDNVERLQTFLVERLPEYMLPATVTALPRMPLTESGKVDRHALSPPTIESAAVRSTPPRTGIELRLAAIWRDLLGRDPTGIEQNFFEAGGHSLMAMRLASRMERDFGKPVPLRAIFENPTLERLASLVEAA